MIPFSEEAAPQGGVQAAGAAKLSDVVKNLAEKLDAPIRTGKFRERALGIYKEKPEVVRVKAANNIATIVHEAGHHIQKKLFGEIGPEPLKAFETELRGIATRTGKDPVAVAEAAKNDQTVMQDLLSVNRDVPGAFAEETLNRLKAGEEVPTGEIAPYRDTFWAQAILNERAGPETLRGKLGALFDAAQHGGKEMPAETWGFVRQQEADFISAGTGLDITPGYTHRVDASAVRHAGVLTSPLSGGTFFPVLRSGVGAFPVPPGGVSERDASLPDPSMRASV
jgi:hypothetical protein